MMIQSRLTVLSVLIALIPSLCFAQIEVAWQTTFSTSLQWQEVTHLGSLIVCTSNELERIDPETGQINWCNTDLASEILKFGGKEIPKKLEALDDDIVLYSDQNIGKFDYNGNLAYNKYYEAPKENGWKRTLLYAESAYATYVDA